MTTQIAITNVCLDALYGWPRRYTYWGGKSWLTGKLLATREDIEKLTRKREPVGVWQCYAEGEDVCAKRDVVVFEYDSKDCNNLACIKERYGNVLRKISNSLAPYSPLTWWNGNKSVYWLVLIEPAPASYVLRPEWLELVRALGMDTSMTTPKHSFRLPCTPHQTTGKPSVWLDPVTFKPIKEPKLPPSRVNPYYFLEPPPPPKPKRAPQRTGKSGGGFNVLEAVRQLVETSPKLRADCRKRLAAFIGGMCAVLEMSLDECLDYMHSLPVEWTKEHERYTKYYYEGAREGKSKFSFRNLITSDVWYSVKECL